MKTFGHKSRAPSSERLLRGTVPLKSKKPKKDIVLIGHEDVIIFGARPYQLIHNRMDGTWDAIDLSRENFPKVIIAFGAS